LDLAKRSGWVAAADSQCFSVAFKTIACLFPTNSERSMLNFFFPLAYNSKDKEEDQGCNQGVK
jgi:hypothetical protein